MTLERLKVLLPPPEAPVDAPGPAAWDEFEASLEIRLPPDYRAFVELYGCGSVGGFLHVLVPASVNRHARLVDAHQAQMEVMRYVRSELPEEVPYALHPEPGGLILWAESSNGDCCYWLAQPPGQPAEWPIVVGEARGPEWYRHAGPMTTFLADVVGRSLAIPFWPEVVFAERRFIPRGGST